jgi:hypothetical protein
MMQFCAKYFLSQEVQFNIQLLTEEVLQIVPLDKGEVDLALKYSEKDGSISIELLMPTIILSVWKNPKFAPDELSKSIIEGLCENIDEVVDDCPEGPRVRIRFKLKMKNEE